MNRLNETSTQTRDGVRDRGEEPGTASSFDAAKRKFKEGGVLLYGEEGEHRKQAVELQTSQKHGTEELHKPGVIRSEQSVVWTLWTTEASRSTPSSWTLDTDAFRAFVIRRLRTPLCTSLLC